MTPPLPERLNFKEMIEEGAKELRIRLDDDAVEKMQKHMELLSAWNKSFNITSIEDPREAAVKHFLDSLACAAVLDAGWRVLDIGSGGGFPGIPVGIVRSDLEITLMERSTKKAVFLNEVRRELGLTGLRVVRHDAEEPPPAGMEHSFDAVVSRATFKPARFFEIASSYLRPGGSAVFMAGPSVCDDEHLLKSLRPDRRLPYSLPFLGHRRCLLIRKL